MTRPAVIDSDAIDVGHLVAEHRAAIAEIERLRTAYKERTDELIRVMAERDDLLAEKGIVHHGSEAT